MKQIRMRLHDHRPVAFDPRQVAFVVESAEVQGQTDIAFAGAHRIAVEGSFKDIAARIFADDDELPLA